jgi:cell wall-associated NlpC family hydrolase
MKRFVYILISLSLIIVSCSTFQGGGSEKERRARVVDTAKKYLGVKYKYGGVNPSGFDCSGLVMYVFRKNGIDISRVLKEQYYSGRRVALNNAKPGDLVFFNTNGRNLSHVGIYIGDHRFIHAPTTGKKVSYATVDNGYWKKRYVGIVSHF